MGQLLFFKPSGRKCGLRKDDWLPPLLREYAKWYLGEFGEGYAGTSTLWRAIYEPTSMPAASTIPKGCIPPPGLGKVQRAYNDLLTSEVGNEVSLVRFFYIVDNPEKAIKQLGLSRRTFYRKKGIGESAIRRYLKEN